MVRVVVVGPAQAAMQEGYCGSAGSAFLPGNGGVPWWTRRRCFFAFERSFRSMVVAQTASSVVGPQLVVGSSLDNRAGGRKRWSRQRRGLRHGAGGGRVVCAALCMVGVVVGMVVVGAMVGLSGRATAIRQMRYIKRDPIIMFIRTRTAKVRPCVWWLQQFIMCVWWASTCGCHV